ncbi:MAG: hypothetical protein V2B18_25620, partial [Pseudomonadota bacterium]
HIGEAEQQLKVGAKKEMVMQAIWFVGLVYCMVALFPVGSLAAEPAKDGCPAVIEYMTKGRAIVHKVKGPERDKQLEALKAEYDPKMHSAPAAAVKHAHAYIAEVVRAWDKAGQDSVYQILVQRDAAFKACGKKPEDVGF